MGAVSLVEYPLSTVTLIIVGIGSEAIRALASLDYVNGKKVLTALEGPHLKVVTTDLESIHITLLVAIVGIGTDAPLYVTEGHRSKGY